MRNQKGITLVELLAALAIVGIITAVIASVLMTGTSSADRTSTKQRLHQEANYIVEEIRSEYLKNDVEDIQITITADSLKIKRMKSGEMDKIVSEGYKYVLKSKNVLQPPNSEQFHLIIKNNNEEYEIKTTFSKLQ
ncbi:type II secretion system GspH family protein [Planococcus sp. MERTA32b]|nr:type II secretion system GspH family protein [Planococcus sp. MER TA 32b]